MTTQALYNKWRGQTFEDILGQEHITTTLLNQVKAGRIGHAYLFAGMRGTGKTSTARIMAKAVNCIGETVRPPCNRCHICRSITEGRSLDLIEIDSASNRGIDEIRDLRDKVNFSPSECRYKVYVIDEVHMLTNEAFNALLKTLEEPPTHVIFILCTTEPHRLPDTVLSRCQRFDFRRGPVPVLLAKLRVICQQEGISIAPEALEFIARRASGSFRDAESLLDQLAAYGAGALAGQSAITLEQVQDILGTVSSSLVTQLIASLMVADVPAGLRVINQAIDNGAEPRQFLDEILDHLRALMLLKVGGEDDLHTLGEEALTALRPAIHGEALPLDLLVRAIRLFNEAANGLRVASRPQIPLELAFIEVALQTTPAVAAVGPARVVAPGSPLTQKADLQPQPEPTTSPQIDAAARIAAEERPQQAAAPAAAAAPETAIPAPHAAPAAANIPPPGAPAGQAQVAEESEVSAYSQRLTLEWVQGKWRQALARMKALNPNVQGLLNSARPIAVRGETITLACEAAFHRDRLSEDKRRDLVERVLSEVLGTPCHIQCTVDTSPRDVTPPQAPPGPSDLFGATTPANEPGREEGQGDEREPAPAGATESTPEDIQARLLSHPAVKQLQKRGGKIAKVSVFEEGKQEDRRGQ